MACLKKRVWIFIILVTALGAAQRLPGGVTPQHYDLSFTPDLEKATFSGDETIQVQLFNRSSSVVLNAAEIAIQAAEFIRGEQAQAAQVSFDASQQQVTLTVPNPLDPGPATVHIRFTGILNDKLRGFYLARTRARRYAATQFESTDARRAFPSFDEPAYKATFDITLIIDKNDTAISNGPITADLAGPDPGKHTVKFSTTAKMSTYLVAITVGDFQCSESSADSIPIRVCGTPDKKPLQAAALRYAGEILKFYDQYYGISYPFGKLDIVGVPDFEAGAMENTAAIFYRESLLFIDDSNSSVQQHQAVFEVLAHEIAHQWFGDLVTMKWWDNIWLNEGFATWMSLKPSQVLHPEWNATIDAVRATNGALQFDALASTHAVRAAAETPQQIEEMFDPISYEKGAAVLRMMESYVSPEVFRRGVNAYLRRFAFSNATAEDFWAALAQASGRPVDRIMKTFIEQPGEPLVQVKTSCVTPPAQSVGKSRRSRKTLQPHPKTEIMLSQQRFRAEATDRGGNDLLWLIPVCIKTGDSRPFCQLLGDRQQVVPTVGCSAWVFTNAGAVGYYRTEYDPADLRKLSGALTTGLTTAERVSLLSDQAALGRAGRANIGDFLDLVGTLSSDAEASVVESYQGTLKSIDDYLLTAADRTVYHGWIRSTFRPLMAKLGWSPVPGENADTRVLRADLIEILGKIGEDPDVISEATRRAKQYLQDPGAVDASLARSVLEVAARNGDANLFDQYTAALASMKSPEPFYNIARAFREFRDPPLIERMLQVAISPSIRNQDAPHWIAAVLANPADQNIAWPWIKAHWTEVENKTTPASIGEVLGATRSFCDAASRNDVQQFFTEHKVASAERTLQVSLERIDACISYREHQKSNMAGWLVQHGGSSSASAR
jgi:aminopeptidase N